MPSPNRSPTMFMPAISGPSITFSGRSTVSRTASVSSSMYSVMPCTSAWLQPLLDRPFAPGEILLLGLLLLAAEFLGQRQQPLGRAGIAVEDDVLAGLAQFGIDVVIDDHLPGIDDAHVHAGLDGVIQEHRMHRLAHRLVAAERERQIGDAAGNMRMRQVLPDPARRLDEVDAVIVVLFEAGRDREDIRIEDDVFRREVRPDRPGCRRRACRSRSCARTYRPVRPRRTPSPPRRRHGGARCVASWMNFSSPSFIEIEFTTGLP